MKNRITDTLATFHLYSPASQMEFSLTFTPACDGNGGRLRMNVSKDATARTGAHTFDGVGRSKSRGGLGAVLRSVALHMNEAECRTAAQAVTRTAATSQETRRPAMTTKPLTVAFTSKAVES
eukprot:Polyplicarium_translucidae@DN3942_c0_g1_i1.p1